MYHLADYMPDIEYIKTLKQGYELPQLKQSQDYIYETAFNKLKEFRAKEGKETSYVSFDSNEVIVYETEYGAGMVIEKIEKYNLTDVLNDKFEGNLDSLRKSPVKGVKPFYLASGYGSAFMNWRKRNRIRSYKHLKNLLSLKYNK